MDPALAAIQAGDDTKAAKLYLARALEVNEDQARSFYATHAYVHALVAGDEDVAHQSSTLLRTAGRLK